MTTAPTGCTWLLDASAAQCQRNEDCVRFAGTACDGARHVCVPTTPSNVTTDGGAGDGPAASDGGLLSCPPDGAVAPGLELLNACTNATCLPFDNGARLHNLASDGTLKPLPDPSGVVPPP